MKCLVCGSSHISLWAKVSDVEYFTSQDSFTYGRCEKCGALSISPVPENKLSEIYPVNYYSFSLDNPSLIERLKIALDRQLFRNLLKPMKGRELSVLDVGGGSGWLLTQARMVESRISYTMVVDIDSGAEEIARSNGHEYYYGRIEDFESPIRFDLILMLNLIEHVKDPVDVLSKVGRLLKPEGKILVKTPNHDSLDARIFRGSYWGGLHCPRHWVLFTPQSLQYAVSAAGLQTEKISFTQGAPFWTLSIMNQLNRVGLIRADKNHPICYHSLTMPLQVLFSIFDFIRKPFSSTSQMFAVLKR